jgi:hypothetical protein
VAKQHLKCGLKKTDVLDLKPAVVVILGGVNDITGNTGPTTIKVLLQLFF